MLTNVSEERIVFLLVILSVTCGCSGAEFKSDYTSEERSALTKFREIVDEVLNTESMKTDEYLIRWIRDTEFNLEKAGQKLKKSMDWRRSVKIDTLNIEDLNNTLPIYRAGFDKTGSPIYLFPFGTWELRKMALAGKRVAVNRQLDSLLELGLKHTDELRKDGQNVTQWIMVVDLTSFNFREHLCLACLPFYFEFITNYEGNYPETIKHMVAVNAPKIFERVLDIGRPIFSPGTRKGLRVFDLNKAEWQGWFLSICKPEQLVTRLGGAQDRF